MFRYVPFITNLSPKQVVHTRNQKGNRNLGIKHSPTQRQSQKLEPIPTLTLNSDA